MKVIIDCDTGNDDAWAIISLLKAEEKLNYKVAAITHVNGNTTVEHSALNTLLVLKTINRMDVPVYRGADSSFIKIERDYEPFHGIDGFGMIYNDKPSNDLVNKKHAVLAMKDLIEENPGDVTIFAIGPLTNVALLYKLFPDVVPKIKALHIMGGNHLGVGNVSKCSEFNFWSDPESAYVVFAETSCPTYIFPWEPCIDAGNGMNFDEWRIGTLSSNNNPMTQLLDPIEVKAYKNKLVNWTPCDNFLACCFIDPRMIAKMQHCNVTVELAGNHTRGMMIIDHLKRNKPNAFVIEKIDVELFKKFMMWVCGHTTDYQFS